MVDPKLFARANEVIDRLFALNEAMESADAFCAYLKELNAHEILVKQYVAVELTDVATMHVAAIRWIHAGILRAAIGTIMSCLDPKDWRGNRASVGRILHLLKDEPLADNFAGAEKGSATALQQARESYEDLLKGDLFDRGKRLRHNVAAHILMTDPPTPKVHYEDVYGLRDAAERIVTGLYAACGRGTPNYLALRGGTDLQGRFFWETYLSGMARRQGRREGLTGL